MGRVAETRIVAGVCLGEAAGRRFNPSPAIGKGPDKAGPFLCLRLVRFDPIGTYLSGGRVAASRPTRIGSVHAHGLESAPLGRDLPDGEEIWGEPVTAEELETTLEEISVFDLLRIVGSLSVSLRL